MAPGLAAQSGDAAGPLLSVSDAQQSALGITVGRADPVSEAFSAPLPGQVVVPNADKQMVTVGAAGVVERMLVNQGERVEKGQVLAELQSPELVQIQRGFIQALLALDLAEREADRDRRLREEGIISERRLQESENALDDARARRAEQRQSLLLAGLAEADLDRLTETRQFDSRLVLRAPIAGMVVSQRATVGERLERAAPVYELAQINRLQLEIHAPIDSCRQFTDGLAVSIEGGAAAGRVMAVGCIVHRIDQGVLVRAEVTEGLDALRPGQLIEAEIARTLDDGEGWRVPRSAVVRRDGRTYLFVAEAAGFRPLAVDVVAREPDSLVVRAALTPDDRIATGGSSALKGVWAETGAQ
nr:efflux RND transporter periplasmic adaptor subunit [Rhodothalassium salexigens]